MAAPDPLVLARAAKGELARRRKMQEDKELCEQSFVDFVRLYWRVIEPETPLVGGWPLELLCDTLTAIAEGQHNRALINVPPGFAKSLLLNVFFGAWLWGPQNLPHLRFISVSYNIGLTERDNIRFQRLISDPSYQLAWGDRVKVIRAGQEVVENSRTGWKRATSTSSGLTGHRADYILIDDPNNPNDVESPDVRGNTNRWLREVMPDRLNDIRTGVIICIQQRTHEQDATGTLSEYGTGYLWVCLPMEFDPLRMTSVVLRRDDEGRPTQIWEDPRGLDEDGNKLKGLYENERGELCVRMGSPMAQAEGTLAWPERFPRDEYEKLKTIKGPYAVAGQYQQSPTARGGGIVRKEWWQLWATEKYPELSNIIVALDTALEEKKDSDYNACTVFGAFSGSDGAPKLLLLDAWQDRLPLAQLVARVAETCYGRRHSGVGWTADYLLIEHKTRGRDVADEIARLYSDAPWETCLVLPSGDKISRLNAVTHLLSGDVRRGPETTDPVTGAKVPGIDVWSGGMVYAPDKDWAQMVIDQVASFPRGAHDDLVDCVSVTLGWIRKFGVVVRKVEWDAADVERRTFRKEPGMPYAQGL